MLDPKHWNGGDKINFQELANVFGGGFSCGSAAKESACNVGDLGSIPGLGRSPGEGKGYPPVFTAALFTVARTWTQPRCPSTDECI